MALSLPSVHADYYGNRFYDIDFNSNSMGKNDFYQKKSFSNNQRSDEYVDSTPDNTLANHIINTGNQYVGTPYQFGARKGNTRSFDCSSFTQYVYGKNGIRLPRSSVQQSRVGIPVSKYNIEKGDLLFFRSPNHVGIYNGNGQILHTYGKKGVTISNLQGRWATRLAKVRRVI